MALNAFALGPGGNISVGPTPLGVQVTGPTIVIANTGITTVYGSLGGSATGATFNPASFILGLPAGTANAAFGTTGAGVGGIAIPPNQSVALTTGGQTFLWLGTLGGQGSVNVANGS